MFNICYHFSFSFFFFNDTATTEIYTLSLHDALPIYRHHRLRNVLVVVPKPHPQTTAEQDDLHLAPLPLEGPGRSEEHTSELQSPCNLVCRLLLEKKNILLLLMLHYS